MWSSLHCKQSICKHLLSGQIKRNDRNVPYHIFRPGKDCYKAWQKTSNRRTAIFYEPSVIAKFEVIQLAIDFRTNEHALFAEETSSTDSSWKHGLWLLHQQVKKAAFWFVDDTNCHKLFACIPIILWSYEL